MLLAFFLVSRVAGGKATTGWREVTNRHERDGEHGRTASTSPPFYCERHGQKAECLSPHMYVCVYMCTRERTRKKRRARTTVCAERKVEEEEKVVVVEVALVAEPNSLSQPRERASEPVSRPRKKEKERGKGERERERKRGGWHL